MVDSLVAAGSHQWSWVRERGLLAATFPRFCGPAVDLTLKHFYGILSCVHILYPLDEQTEQPIFVVPAVYL